MRVLLIQRTLAPPGGGNAVGAWMLHALAGTHEVGTLTLRGWSPEETNAFYGTAIPGGVIRHVVPRPWRWLALLSNDRLHRLRRAALLRQARQLDSRYDLLITTDDFGVFEKPGIQYLNYPDGTPRATPLAALVSLYFRFCDWWMGAPWSRAARNLTLANSRWTATRLAGAGEMRVRYPPVVDTGPGEPWASRANAFLCVGRFHPSKRIETVMSIVQRLRAHAIPDARLIIVGSVVDAGYAHRLRQAAARLGRWIEFREDLSRSELNTLMGRSRYGVHAMEGEHFGMATAEMVRAGCLVLAHRSGGSIEVVDGAAELLWVNEDEAVARASALSRDAALRQLLRARLRRHGSQFSTERFVQDIRAIVAERGSDQVS